MTRNAIVVLAVLVLSAGCSMLQNAPKIHAGGGLLSEVSATAPKDTGKPAVVNSSGEESRLELPAGSTVTVTRTEATATKPAYEVREIRLSSDSAWFEKAQRIAANTGTVDTSVATHRIDVAARAPLLYAAIGAIVVAGAILFLGWPKVATLAGVASAIFFAAWQAAALPQWFWMIGAGLLVVGLGIMAGWILRDKDGNGVPDILEKKATA